MRTSKDPKTGSHPYFPHLSPQAGATFFPAILNTLEEPLFLFDNEFKIIWYNKACNDLYQHISGRPIDRSFDFNELLTKEQQPLFYEYLHKVLAGEKAHFEWRYNKSISKWISVSLYPFIADDGSFTGICGSMRDITDQKINEFVLLRNTAVLNNISDAVIYTDSEQRIVYVNKSAETIYGLAPGQITGKPFFDAIRFEYAGDKKQNAEKSIARNGSWEGKIAFTRNDGQTIYLLASITPLLDKHENRIGLIAAAKDITDEELNGLQSQRRQENIDAIINNIGEGVLLIDTDLTILSFNERAYALEMRMDTCLSAGRKITDLLPEYRKNAVLEYFKLTLNGHSPEYEVLYPDNTWLLINFLPVKNEEGIVHRIVITSRDITERKRAEELIKTNERKYKALVNSLSEGVILQTADDKIITVNRSAAQILGVTVDELKQNGFFCSLCSIIDEDKKEISQKDFFFKRNGRVNEFKNKVIGLRRKDHIQWLKLNAAGMSGVHDNESNAIVISFEDITEQKRISGEMEILSIVAKETNNSVIIFDKDSDGDTLWVNEGFTRVTGFLRDDIIGKNSVEVLIGPETDLVELNNMRRQIINNLPYTGELLIYAKDGNKQLHQVSGQPIKDANGRVTKYFVIGTDITEHRRLEEERLQKEVEQQKEITRITIKTQESERNELGKELHDNINQILGAVKLQLSFCVNNDAGKVTPVLEVCIENLQEAMTEIRNLSHRMVMPRFSNTTLEHELNRLIGKYSKAATFLIDGTEWNEDKVPPTVKETFFRIAQEQLNNIQKHARADNVLIRLKSDDHSAALFIKDNGVGFDSRQVRAGIGMSNIINRAEAYNGTCFFTSEPGKGCIVSVSIPLQGT